MIIRRRPSGILMHERNPHMKISNLRPRLIAGALLLALAGTSLLSVAAEGNTVSLSATEIRPDDRLYDWVESDTAILSYDFTSTNILTYSKDENLANVSLRTNMIFDGETLSCKAGKTFSFGSAVFLGDDYGIRGGDLAFDLKQTGGKLAVGLRLQKTAASSDKRGLWFTFDGQGNLTVTAPETDLFATYTGIPTDVRLSFRDLVHKVEVWADDTLIACVHYADDDGALTVLRVEDGEILAQVASAPVNAAGYFTLYADDMKGTIDNLSFSRTTLAPAVATNAPVVDYSQWVAIDDRDRVTPTNETTGDIREGKQVGMFYFLCHQGGSSSEVPRDTTYLYNKLGLDGMRDYMSDPINRDGYYWAEPYFGYYMNTDEWVHRKHAYMLEAAGVDFIYVDVSNGATYDTALRSLFDTWKAIRDEGGSTPDICFLAAGSIGAVWNNVKGYIYNEEGTEKYGDLFYQYKGKPLLLADISVLDADTQAELSERFTIRHTWAWSINGSVWNWLQEYEVDEDGNVTLSNGKWGHDGNGNHEQLALCMGHHPTTSKGRSYVNSQLIMRDDYGFGLDSGAGLGYANSFRAVKKLDPDMMLITGWNEWTAGLQQEKTSGFAGMGQNPFYLVDLFNTEYSRDGEPMKLRDGDGVGFGDNYYYQTASYIREFKGWDPTPVATAQGTIRLGDAAAWNDVGPAFNDIINDTEWRHATGYFNGYTYVNGSGRNDLKTAKVSQDADYLYFRIETVRDLIIADDTDWMNLYLNVDSNNTNGWEGFDIVLNRARDGHYVSVESLADGWEGKHIGQALYTTEQNAMVIRVSKSLIGIDGTASELLFKWADNATVDGNIMEFMDKGDTAPNDRYAYRYLLEGDAPAAESITYKLSTGAERNESEILPGLETETETETESESATETGTETDAVTVTETTLVTESESATESTSDTDSVPADGTETSTEIETPAATESLTVQEPPAASESSTEAETKEAGGCASVACVSGLLLMAVGTTAVLLRKRKK